MRCLHHLGLFRKNSGSGEVPCSPLFKAVGTSCRRLFLSFVAGYLGLDARRCCVDAARVAAAVAARPHRAKRRTLTMPARSNESGFKAPKSARRGISLELVFSGGKGGVEFSMERKP